MVATPMVKAMGTPISKHTMKVNAKTNGADNFSSPL
jgi:hypothetical protein